MRYSKPLLSVAAGMFMPLPLLALLNAMHAAAAQAGAPPLGWPIALTAAFLASVAVGLWRPIVPAFYGSAFIVGTPVWYAAVAGADRASNLFGLALMLMAVAGVIVGVAAGLCATLIRHWPVPGWTPLVPLAAAAILIPFARLSETRTQSDDNTRTAQFLLRIAAAEADYAEARPDHAYSCDGPQLAATGVEWRGNRSLGTQERNEAQYHRYWIRLQCEVSARPSWFVVTAVATWPRGPRITYDSRKHDIEIR